MRLFSVGRAELSSTQAASVKRVVENEFMTKMQNKVERKEKEKLKVGKIGPITWLKRNFMDLHMESAHHRWEPTAGGAHVSVAAKGQQ
jgi:hypothetical protein